jgi:hypothetical protein
MPYLTLRSVSMQCNAMQCNTMQYNAMQCNAMQCNTMQCNAIQCNAMQCNAMYVQESVRPYGMKSVSHFFSYFFSQYVRSVSMYGTRMSRMDRQRFQLFFLSSMYECHGWTDKFQLFQFSFSSVAYSPYLSVRTEVPTKRKKMRRTRNTNNFTRSDRRY